MSNDFRSWLKALSDPDLGVLITLCAPLRVAAQVPANSMGTRATRRELRAVRAWIGKTPAATLAQFAVAAPGVVSDLLVDEFGFNEEAVANPATGELGDMLTALPNPFGRLVLYGLLLGDYTASPRARANREELESRLWNLPEADPDLGSSLLGEPKVAAADDSGPVAAHRINATCTDELIGAAVEQLLSLREIANRVGDLVGAAAKAVLAGEPLTGDLGGELADYTAQRDQVITAVREVVEIGPESDLRAVEEALADARAWLRHQEAAALTSQVGELDRQIALLEPMARSSGPAAESLARGLAELRAERARLLGEPATVEPEPASSEPEHTAPEHTAPEPEQPVAATSTVAAAPTTVSDSVEVRVPEVPPDVPAPPTRPTTEPADHAEPEEGITAGEFEQAFPWEEGEPPLAVGLAAAGKLAEAYWVTAMSSEDDIRAEVLRLAAAAYATHGTADATAVLSAMNLDVHALANDTDAAVIAATAALRASMVAGWCQTVPGQQVAENALAEPWPALITACVAAVRGGRLADHRADASAPVENAADARAELGARAAALIEEMPRRRNTLHRATRVLQRLMQNGQPLAEALAAVCAWAEGHSTGHRLAAIAADLRDPHRTDQLIEEADMAMRGPKQAREPIVATARRTLLRAIDEVRQVVDAADAITLRLAAAERDGDTDTTRLIDALAAAAAAQPPPGMAGAALSLFRQWLLDPQPAQPSDATLLSGIPEPSTDVLLGLSELPWDSTGKPDRANPRTAQVLAGLGHPLDLDAALATHCANGDFQRANRLVQLAEEGRWQPASAAPPQEVVAAAIANWTRKHREDFARARGLFERVRRQNLLGAEAENEAARAVEALTTVAGQRFDIATADLAALTGTLAERERVRVAELRADLRGHQVSPSDLARIETCLSDGDTVTATEFVSFIRAGEPLPEAKAPARDVDAFVDLLRRGDAMRLTGKSSRVLEWAQLAADGSALAEGGSSGVRAWDSLRNTRQHSGDKITGVVREVLRTLGLRVELRSIVPSSNGRMGYRRFQLRGTPSDGSYVAALGSAAATYSVTVVTEEQTGRSLLDVLAAENVGMANVVLYLHPMGLTTRRALAAQSAASQVQALVVDPAVLGWVAATAPGSWRATQRVTLPWTAFNPYTPFVAGLVPPEVFVGRDREISQLVDAHGGLFVYGGRQLGKSALLRRIEATFNDEHRRAVYLDLKGRGIGEAEPASRIWRELAALLKAEQVLDGKVSDDPPAEVVVSQVRRWLEENPGRRLLLLADESDAFLTADSRGVPTPGGVAHFPNMLRLKDLMEATERRFKVIFAGLHQVQRFGHLPNVPVAQGGPDILIGPLAPHDAGRLVTEPMAALGFAFDRPELVWRLLSATNYQASLIQIFCDELVTSLHTRAARAGSAKVPIKITEDDVEAVAASDRVRGLITDRLRITINLEDRYRVLALVAALLSLADRFGAVYDPETLLREARLRWPAGFDELTVPQVTVYLNEMVGLGLLIKLQGEDRYAVRSPNVVNMLGTKASLERELLGTDFDLPYEYNPREARMVLDVADGTQLRSPLTDGQLADLVRKQTVSVLTGTVALGVDRVADAVTAYVKPRGNSIKRLESVGAVVKAVSDRAHGAGVVLLTDLRGKPAREVREAAQRLAKAKSTSILLVDPGQADLAAEEADSPWTRPERWTASDLRSWPESPFDVPTTRAELVEATGGWPELVELVIATIASGRYDRRGALDRIRNLFDDADSARKQLDRAGLTTELVERAGLWAQYVNPGDSTSPADVASVLNLELPEVTAMLDEMSRLGILDEDDNGVALDRVVHRCLLTVVGAT
ncbi:hypothetical protein CLV68_6184 [Actinokineospora cianjurensis]|uniref:AAA domain-containing protein n=1 Tax=Actinokineospora cianjurensis TaxID=585224 RepID=A0A421AVU5_9PSEU|nr:hypothetical protein CLV68_6184 [Actinokineospora cianjurensis]